MKGLERERERDRGGERETEMGREREMGRGHIAGPRVGEGQPGGRESACPV